MTTTMDHSPIEVETLDLVGYTGNGNFVILNPIKRPHRKLPPIPNLAIPWCIKCVIKNNQVVNFGGDVVTLHDLDGKWHYKRREPSGQIRPLDPFTFFEIGDCR